jgi:hypothetical protein
LGAPPAGALAQPHHDFRGRAKDDIANSEGPAASPVLAISQELMNDENGESTNLANA